MTSLAYVLANCQSNSECRPAAIVIIVDFAMVFLIVWRAMR